MISKELYCSVLDKMQSDDFLAECSGIIQAENYDDLGDLVINKVKEVMGIDLITIKKIVCMYCHYTKEQFQELSHQELCILVCEKIIEFKSYPKNELQEISLMFEKTQKEYLLLIEKIDLGIEKQDSYIKVDKDFPNHCGTLIKKQRSIYSANVSNKSLLKDLQKYERDYEALQDEIQEKYVYREMLLYAKEKIESAFNDTILTVEERKQQHVLTIMCLERARKEGDWKEISNVLMDYDRCILSWNNAMDSIYKPFFMVKMRKFRDDIETFYNENYNGAYWNKTEELLTICQQRSEAIYDSDKWIELKEKNQQEYVVALKEYVSVYDVLGYITECIDKIYCLQKRKNILTSIVKSFVDADYSVFTNLVVVQIEGLFYDMFMDANIQSRLDGDFDLYDKDDLRGKIGKNDTTLGIEEAALYFKYYFNNMIRNKVAHGKGCFESSELEKMAYELLLDLQYVLHLLLKYSDTCESADYVRNTLKWIEHSFSGESSMEERYTRILNALNDNVLKRKRGDVCYVDSHQELYWIFNPYYEDAYKFGGVLEERNKLRDYVTSVEFWTYVLAYVNEYNMEGHNRVSLNPVFKSRVKAIQMYIAKNRRETLSIITDVSKKLETMEL